LILVKFYTLNLPPPVLIKLVFMQREINSGIVLLTRNLFINYDKKEENSYMQRGRGIERYASKAVAGWEFRGFEEPGKCGAVWDAKRS